MKKYLTLGLSLLFITLISCSKTPDQSPMEELSITTSDSSTDKVLIRLKPKVGDAQKMAMTVDVSSAGNQDLNMKMAVKMDLTVIAKEDVVYTYELKYNSIQMDVNTGGMGFSFNSESDVQQGMGAMLKGQLQPILDNPWQLKLDDKGRLVDFNVPKGGDVPELGDMGSISIPLPVDPVGMGDTWTAEREMEDMGTMRMKMELDKITIDHIVILTTGDLIDNSGNILGQFSGNYKLDRASGLTKDGTMNVTVDTEGQQMNMKMNFKAI